MITAGDFKNGLTFEMDGKVYQVIEFQHVKPGKGAAFVRTKYRDVVTGAIREASFNPTAKFENAVIERKDLEYLYTDGELYYFMDPESYEQIPLNQDKLGDTIAKIVDLQQEINQDVDRFVDMKREAARMMKKIKKPEFFQVLHKRYILGESLEQITFDMGYTHRGMCYLHGRALQAFGKVLEETKALEDSRKNTAKKRG